MPTAPSAPSSSSMSTRDVSPATTISNASHPSPNLEPRTTNGETVHHGPLLTVNGGPTVDAVLPPPKKPTLTSRLTRMFSQQTKPGGNRERDSDGERETLAKDRSGHSSHTEVNGDRAGRPSVASRQTTRNNGSRGTTPDGDKKVGGSGSSGNSTSGKSKDKDHDLLVAAKRFELKPDGTHEHHLKGIKRQEKLSDMLRDLVVGKRKDEHAGASSGGGEEPQLSLMSGWVDQFRHERDKTSSSSTTTTTTTKDAPTVQDKKGGPNATASLVQKYGRCQEVVGRGAFGVVRVAHKADPHDARSEQLYAVKEFRRRPGESPKRYQKRLTSEFCISASLRHPNVIHTLDLLQDAKGDYCEVMEFCAGGDLYSLVLAAGKLEVAEADCFFKQLMRGVEYMHEMGVAHRDLKPENLLLTTHGALKITDFGNGECFRMAWENEARMTAGLCGSAPYIAPEEYIANEFDPRAVDVWATGVIYMAMRTGRHLWTTARNDDEGDDFYSRYLEGRRDEAGYAPIESLHRARCRNVIYSILDPNPSRRITASQVLKSEWLREIKLCRAGEEGF
ncbi:MAG: Pkinase-domain-containing protein [Watsoniomyces obsoletus]|nr:MAG: Pkinase-domain-containing protein [Watsoniomyces obsoletus]